MRLHLKLTVPAVVLLMSTFSTAHADRIRTDQVAPMPDLITIEHSLYTAKDLPSPESLNSDSGTGGDCVFSFSQDVRGTSKGVGALSIERHRDDVGRMHLPGFAVSIPEPMTIVLMATGLLGLAGVVRRRV